MSRPSHRKSQSTSALAFLASHEPSSSSSSSSMIPPSAQTSRERESLSQAKYRQHRSSMLPSVKESGASMSVLPGLTGPRTGHRSRNATSASMAPPAVRSGSDKSDVEQRGRERHGRSGRSDKPEGDMESWLSDIRSLRSSDRRRLAALRGLERCLITACIRNQDDHGGESVLLNFTCQSVYQALISLLTRHAQTLSTRASSSSIAPVDEVAAVLILELNCVVSMLQGICLLSKGCKAAVGESWVLEVFIDLLLLLRAQPAAGEGMKPIAYNVMELLFCVLVDSPTIARTFEKLSGLEAVTRVLKGTGVAKDVRMKCIEFLYFYLLPENTDSSRAVSSSSTSSTSSSDSHLYPPSPLSTSRNSTITVKLADDVTEKSPSPGIISRKLADVDLPFIPMTPRKPPQPALGYLTPSTRKVSVCGSTSSTPSLATVPASPRVEHSASSRGLAAMLDEMEEPIAVAPTPRSNRMGRTKSDDSERSSGSSSVGLGLGLPKTTSGIVRSNTVQQDLSSRVTTIVQQSNTSTSSRFTDPFSMTMSSERSHSGSSGSSTVVPSPRTMSRSSTQPTLVLPPSGPRSPSSARRTSVRRVSKSPLVQSTVPEKGETPERPRLSALPADPTPRTQKMRHSRTQSHLSALAMPSVPPVPAIPAHITPVEPGVLSRSPSRPHRAFPAELTRGLPPSASSPVLSQMVNPGPTPLGATKRVLSGKRPSISAASGIKEDRTVVTTGLRGVKLGQSKDVRSVEEKKEMLGMWLGNVDQLVQGVEKVSIWGSVGAVAKGRR